MCFSRSIFFFIWLKIYSIFFDNSILFLFRTCFFKYAHVFVNDIILNVFFKNETWEIKYILMFEKFNITLISQIFYIRNTFIYDLFNFRSIKCLILNNILFFSRMLLFFRFMLIFTFFLFFVLFFVQLIFIFTINLLIILDVVLWLSNLLVFFINKIRIMLFENSHYKTNLLQFVRLKIMKFYYNFHRNKKSKILFQYLICFFYLIVRY